MREITKLDFVTCYRTTLLENYAWAGDLAKLDRFLVTVLKTLEGATIWHYDSPAACIAWCSLGFKGKPTLKALRKLA